MPLQFALRTDSSRVAVVLSLLTMSAALDCQPQDNWDCSPMGTSRRCTEKKSAPLLGAPWRCFETSANEVCAAVSSPSAPLVAPSAWSCR